MSKTWALLAGGTAASAIAVGVYFAFFQTSHTCVPSGSVAGEAAIGGPFELVTHKGKTVTEKDVIDGLSLVYFGYTFCPDVCPFDMARNAAAVDILDAQGIDVKPVFITIDPTRDTVEALSDYVDVMHPKMVALTGTDAQVSTASKAYKTFYRKNGEGEDYLMDHTTFTYLMSPNGFLDFIRRDVTAEELAQKAGCYAS